MPTYRELTLHQGNGETLAGSVVGDDGPLDLTGLTLEMLIKPSADADDDDPAAVVLSTSTGEIDVGAETGTYTVDVPPDALVAAGPLWYRLDVVASSRPRTVVYGPLWVRDT